MLAFEDLEANDTLDDTREKLSRVDSGCSSVFETNYFHRGASFLALPLGPGERTVHNNTYECFYYVFDTRASHSKIYKSYET